MKNKNLTIGIIIVIIVVAVTAGTAYYQQMSSGEKPRTSNTISNENFSGNYEDGVYEVTGNYISPGGAEEIGVVLTLENNVIVESEVEVRAEREISLEMQNDFAANYKDMVIGKNIDEVELTKVSGSSLTPQGFNDALEKVKVQAQS